MVSGMVQVLGGEVRICEDFVCGEFAMGDNQ